MSQTAVVRFKVLRVFFVLLGIGLAFGAQVVLTGTWSDSQGEGAMQAVAVTMEIVGAVLFGAALPRAAKPSSRLEFPRNQRVSPPAMKWRSPWALVWLIGAMVLTAVSMWMFDANGEDLTVVLLWLGGILALFVGQLWGVRMGIPRIASKQRVHFAVLVIVLVVAFVSRSYRLTTLPYNLDGDFASVGLEARALVDGQQEHIFANGWAAIPMLAYLPPWLTMKVFGTGLLGLNASGVLEGLLIILGVYLLGRDLFHSRVGLFAAILLTISYTHLAASRQSSYIDPVFFMVYAIYFLLVGLREGKGWAIVASGVLTALCLQMYYSGRLVVFIAAFVFLYLLLFRRSWLLARFWTVALWGVSVLVGLGPMLLVFLRDLDSFMSRTREVFILNPDVVRHMQGVYGVDTIPALLLEQIRHSVMMLNYYIDKSTQYALSQPFLDPFAAGLFFLGVGYALFRWRWVGYASTLAWLVLGIIVGCFLTVNPPFWPRLMILLPATALLAAFALNQIYLLVCRGLGRIAKPAMLIAPVATVLLLTVVGIINWNSYFAAKSTYATPRTSIGRYLATQPESVRGYLVSDDFDYTDRELEFLAPGRLVADMTPEEVVNGIDPAGTPTLVILSREQTRLLEKLYEQFPGGLFETVVGNSADEVAFYVFQLPDNPSVKIDP